MMNRALNLSHQCWLSEGRVTQFLAAGFVNYNIAP